MLEAEPKGEKRLLPKTVDREQFTDVLRKLIAAPPLPKAAIPRKSKPKTARQPKSQARPKR